MVPRFLSGVPGALRVVFAGSKHFTAGLQLTQELLDLRGISSSDVELLQVAPGPALAEAMQTAHLVLPFMERIDTSLLQSAPELRCILQFGVGLEGVDIEAATRCGIAVSNMPSSETGNAEATAELALFLAIALLRHLPDLPRRFQSSTLGGLPIPRQVRGKYVSVVGYGAIGKALCRSLTALGAHVFAVRRSPWQEEADGGAEDEVKLRTEEQGGPVDLLERFAPKSDVIILTCPLTPETRGLVSADFLAMCKPGVLIVNVGRGPVVDHAAILQGLESNQVGGFASDVGVGHPTKASEPWDPTDVLSQHPRTIFTPHVGGYCDVSYDSMARICVDTIERIRRGQPPAVWVNKERMSAM
mmetsp:Transcript_53155/g.154709  ORF Transcript_53155/g.154709 Transcript_53155/m.154709 type:complete len:359 (+) Transcript_53155:140-1216(+)